MIKFTLLRALAGQDRKLGVAWYYNPTNDGGPDGRHLEWQTEEGWQILDPTVHAGLTKLKERSIAALERAPIWPNEVMFHRQPVPARRDRAAWAAAKRAALEAADLVFLDPDTGLGAEAKTHATYAELRHLRRPGRSLMTILFPGQARKHSDILADLQARLRTEADAERILTLRTNVSVPRQPGSNYVVQRPRWFAIVDPDQQIIARADAYAQALSSVPRVTATLDLAE